jgi:hypothetical protein
MEGHAEKMHRLDGNAVVAVTGEKATDAPDAIANGRRRRRQIEDAHGSNLRFPALKYQSGDAQSEAAIPGESRLAPQRVPTHLTEIAGGIEDVPHLGSHNARHHGYSHHPHRVRFDPGTLEGPVRNKSGRHSGYPQHEPKSRQGNWSKVEVGNHTLSV